MLQWMGGSRRKVTTSSKSSHKRQKQYFEQRKRQQQQEQSASSESYANGQFCANNRSLDILSLVNVSTLAQEHNTSCHNARYNSEEDDDFTLSHQISHPPPAIITNAGHVDQSELNDEKPRHHTLFVSGTLPTHRTEAEYSKKVSIRLPGHIGDLVGNANNLAHDKLSTAYNISVIDLLGDGGTNMNAVENSLHTQEAHVAFSVEGLGEVETKTPVHSPEMQHRSSTHSFSSPRKSRRLSMPFKNSDCCFDDLATRVDKLQDVVMEGMDFSPYKSPIKQPFLSRGMLDIDNDPNEKSLNFRKFSPFNWNGSPTYGDSGNDELSYNIRESGSNLWNVGPSFLDDSTDDLGEYKSFRKTRVDESNIGYYDYFHNKDIWEQDFNFQDCNPRKKRPSTKRTEIYDMSESPVPYLKHKIMKDLPDVIIPDTSWCYTVGVDNDVKDADYDFVREEAKESMSRLSEESCSSTAVWGDVTKKPGENRT